MAIEDAFKHSNPAGHGLHCVTTPPIDSVPAAHALGPTFGAGHACAAGHVWHTVLPLPLYVPGGQSEHELVPFRLYVPAGQWTGAASCAQLRPGGHQSHVVAAAFAYVPCGHLWHAASPALLYVPLPHCAGELAAEVHALPAGHSVHTVDRVSFAYVPGGHFTGTYPGFRQARPAGQSTHAPSTEYWPSAHAAGVVVWAAHS